MSERLWEHLKMPRPLKLQRPLKVVSFTIAEDQAKKLGRMTNASEYIRDLIDRDSLSEERPAGLVAIISKIAALKRERMKMLEAIIMDDSDYDVSMLEGEDVIYLVVKGNEVYQEFYDDEDYEYFLLPLNAVQLMSFGDEHSLIDRGDDEYMIRNSKPAFLELVKGSLGADKNVIDSAEARLGEIDAEIERLGEHLSTVT